MPFNTNIAPEQSSGLTSALGGFLTAFAHSYAEGRARELENLNKKIKTRNDVLEEVRDFGQKGFSSVTQEEIDSGKYTPEEQKAFVDPAYSAGYNGIVKYRKNYKESAPKFSTPEQILAAKNTIRDDINKRKSEMWDAFPILSSAVKDLSNLGSSDKIYGVLEQGSDWLDKKTRELDNYINTGAIKPEMRDPLLTEIKNMVPLLGDYKHMSERMYSVVRDDRSGLKSKNSATPMPVKSSGNVGVDGDLKNDIAEAKKAIASNPAARKDIINELKKVYGSNMDFEKLITE